MLSAGAYSKKYQKLEREKLQHVRDQERKATRERTLKLSKQTAQRQKALEEKKQAMAIAEEQRRRKALDERRKAQHEATARFKSAICRIKSNPRAKRKPVDNIEIYLPDKHKAKPNNSSSSNHSGQPLIRTNAHQRVVYGKDVEIKNGVRHSGLHRRTPSLDDVLNQISEGGDQSTPANGHPPNPHSHGRINVHFSSASPSTGSQHHTGTVLHQQNQILLRGRSASDPNLNSLASSYMSTCTSNDKAQPSCIKDNLQEAESKGGAANMRVEEVEMSPSDELMVFKPVTSVGGGRKYPTLATVAGRTMKSDDSICVVSPEPADSSSSSGRSFSPPLSDSLDRSAASRYIRNSVSRQLKEYRQQHDGTTRRKGKVAHQQRPDCGDSVQKGQHSLLTVTGVPAADRAISTPPPSLPPTPTTLPLRPPAPQPIFICKDSDSSSDDDNDSLNEEGSYSHNRTVVNQSKKEQFCQVAEARDALSQKPKKYYGCVTVTEAETEAQPSNTIDASEIPNTHSKPKLVGILKKTSSSSVDQTHPGSSTGLERPQSRLDDSQTSTTSSVVKAQKRVRFFDQVNSNHRHSPTPRSDSVWHKVLPNGFSAHHLPNSAFTPKMKLLLSSKTSAIPPAVIGPPKKPMAASKRNGITVHIPVASVDTCSPQQIQKSSQLSASDDNLDTNEAQCEAEKSCKKSDDPSNLLNESNNVKAPTTTSSSAPRDDDHSSVKTPSVSSKPLDKTPTDNEINEMWEQIRNCLEENKQSTVPMQVYPFQTPSATSVYGREIDGDLSVTLQREQSQSLAAGTAICSDTSFTHGHQQATATTNEQEGVKLVHRQSSRSRPMRCHQPTHVHPSTQLTKRQQGHLPHSHSATYPGSGQEQAHGHLQHRVYPPTVQVSSREPQLVVRATASTINGRMTPTSLSLEEQRLLQSIEKLNQRLKDHLAVRPQESIFQYPPSPSIDSHSYPPEYHRPTHRLQPPHQNLRTRGHTKQGGHRIGMHYQHNVYAQSPVAATNSKTDLKIKTHRQNFYNT